MKPKVKSLSVDVTSCDIQNIFRCIVLHRFIQWLLVKRNIIDSQQVLLFAEKLPVSLSSTRFLLMVGIFDTKTSSIFGSNHIVIEFQVFNFRSFFSVFQMSFENSQFWLVEHKLSAVFLRWIVCRELFLINFYAQRLGSEIAFKIS